jgi:hypothetical protein
MMFHTNLWPPSSGSKSKLSKKTASRWHSRTQTPLQNWYQLVCSNSQKWSATDHFLIRFWNECNINTGIAIVTVITGKRKEKIKSRLNYGNACYLLPSHLIPKSVSIKVHKTVILPVVWEMISHLNLRTWTEGGCEEGAEQNILTQDRVSNKSWRKVHSGKFNNKHLCQMFFEWPYRGWDRQWMLQVMRKAHKMLAGKPEKKGAFW